MTRYEYLKNVSVEEMANVLCNIIDNLDTKCTNNCDCCLVSDKCVYKHNGFIDWLNDDAVFTDNAKQLRVWD